jgi:hypothetical protein
MARSGQTIPIERPALRPSAVAELVPDAEALLERGITAPFGVLVKPFTPEELLAEARRCLRSAARGRRPMTAPLSGLELQDAVRQLARDLKIVDSAIHAGAATEPQEVG